MIIKTLILDCHNRMLQILRNLINCHILSVGPCCHQLGRLTSVCRKHFRGISRRDYIHFGYIRCGCEDSFKCTHPETHCRAASHNDSNQQKFPQYDSDFMTYSRSSCVQLFCSPAQRSSSIVHSFLPAEIIKILFLVYYTK